MLVIGTPWYDRHYGYYYDGSHTYGANGGGWFATFILTVILFGLCIMCCVVMAKH